MLEDIYHCWMCRDHRPINGGSLMINLYEYKGAHIKKKTQKALDGERKFDRTKEEGRRENWTFLMIGTCKSGEED
jgi:hypothetical protein